MSDHGDIAKIKLLRDSTGLSLNEIRKALQEAHGNERKALEALQVYQGVLAEKKASRAVKEGVVDAYVHGNKKVGSMIELLCETDFVARNEEFRQLAHDIAMHVAAMRPVNTEELLEQSFVKDPATTVRKLIDGYIARLGENIQVGEFSVFEL